MPTGTAKRLGWDEQLTPAQEHDMTPYDLDGEYPSDDVAGEVEEADTPVGRVLFVGGAAADPATLVLDLEPAPTP